MTFQSIESILPSSLKPQIRRQEVAAIMASALNAVDPAVAVKRFLKIDGHALFIEDRSYNLFDNGHIWMIAIGKAAIPMAQAGVEILGNWLSGGIVVVKEGFAQGHLPENITVLEAGHPIPDIRGHMGAQQIESLLQHLSADDLVIFLISGGASALLPYPYDGISLADLQILSQHLLNCGASINEINTLRKHLEIFKGGQIIRFTSSARVISLILSDVVGNPLDIIASGLTVPDPSTYLDSINILQKYQLIDVVPHSIKMHLQKGLQGEIPDTPKPGDVIFHQVHNEIIGSNLIACQAACSTAKELGYNAQILTTSFQGEARQAGRTLGSILNQISLTGQPQPRPACIIVGGETTVTIKGTGKGGRNLELALSAAIDLAGLPNVALITLATDGNDGPTDAAGAYTDGTSLHRAERHTLDALQYLENNDSYPFFEKLGDLIKTGPTQTNVNDLAFLFAFS